jgi:hypothetical protein
LNHVVVGTFNNAKNYKIASTPLITLVNKLSTKENNMRSS